MSRNESFDSIQLQFGDQENDWPTLKANEAKQLSLEKADFKLEANSKVTFDGNGQISGVGDLSFLTGTPSPTEQLKIFANGNIGIGTGTRQPTDKFEVAGKIQATELEVSGTITAANGFIGDGSQLTGIGGTSLWVGDEANIFYEGNVGIGTETPAAKLQVAGNLKLESGIPVNEFVSDLQDVQGDGIASVPTVAALNKVVDKLQDQFKKILDQLEAVKKELEEVKKESATVKQELMAARQEIKFLQNNIKSLQTQNQSLQQQNQNVTTELQNTKNELNELKNQINRVRPAGVIAVNSRNEWIALRAGRYDTGYLESTGIRNDQLASIFIPPRWKVFCYRYSNFSGPLTTAGPFGGWGHVPDWLNTQVSSIVIQAG